MNRADRRQQQKTARAESRAFVATLPEELARVPDADIPAWPFPTPGPVEVWRSRHFVVQVFAPTPGEATAGVVARVAVRRTSGLDGITWDELQGIKRSIGRGGEAAVELYPPDGRVVAVANMRWLWFMAECPRWAWKGHR